MSEFHVDVELNFRERFQVFFFALAEDVRPRIFTAMGVQRHDARMIGRQFMHRSSVNFHIDGTDINGTRWMIG